MKAALKLNKKELIAMYEKSSAQVRKSLCAEFGEGFFIDKAEVKSVTPKDSRKPINEPKRTWLPNLETIFDFTYVLRIAGYALLICIVLNNI